MHMRDEGLLEPRRCPILELVTKAHAGRWSQQRVVPSPQSAASSKTTRGRVLTDPLLTVLAAVVPESPEERAPNVTYQ